MASMMGTGTIIAPATTEAMLTILHTRTDNSINNVMVLHVDLFRCRYIIVNGCDWLWGGKIGTP